MASVRLRLNPTTMDMDMVMEDTGSMVWGPMEALVMAMEAMESMASVKLRLSRRVVPSPTTMEALDMVMEDMGSMVWGPMEALVTAMEAMESMASVKLRLNP